MHVQLHAMFSASLCGTRPATSIFPTLLGARLLQACAALRHMQPPRSSAKLGTWEPRRIHPLPEFKHSKLRLQRARTSVDIPPSSRPALYAPGLSEGPGSLWMRCCEARVLASRVDDSCLPFVILAIRLVVCRQSSSTHAAHRLDNMTAVPRLLDYISYSCHGPRGQCCCAHESRDSNQPPRVPACCSAATVVALATHDMERHV